MECIFAAKFASGHVRMRTGCSCEENCVFSNIGYIA